MALSFDRLEVVVLAAGKGTRMKSKLPKVLHRLCGQSLLARVLKAASGLNPARIVVVAGYEAELVSAEIDALKTYPFLENIEVEVVLQEQQKGTGHAAQVGLSKVSDKATAVLILPGDSPLLRSEDLALLLTESGERETELCLLSCEHPQPHGFGRIIRDSNERIIGIVEEKDCSDEQRQVQEINTSIYLCAPKFLAAALSQLDSKNAQGELYLTDIVAYAVTNAMPLASVKSEALEPVLGANTRAELSVLERFRRTQINQAWMEQGVTLEDPEHTYIDEDVSIGSDCFIGAGTKIRGHSIIADDVSIEGLSLIIDSNIGTGSEIRLSCEIESSKIGDHCSIGPFAHLRPGSFLWDKVKIGNFVETKKAELYHGVKVNHLSYIGDAEVRGGTNTGAGTITCNYDGANKHKPKLDAGVFIGSNTALVAPIEIGQGAYVAAGSTLTQNVPKGSLGVARGQQRNIDGWAERKKMATGD